MSFEDKLNDIRLKYDVLGKKLLNPEELGGDFAKISKEYSNLEPIAKKNR